MSTHQMGAAYRFGFLDWSTTIEFDGGVVEPLPDLKERQASLNRLTESDGFFYPWMAPRLLSPSHREDIGPFRCAAAPILSNLDASHTLTLFTKQPDDLRDSDAGFIIHALAYLFGVRLQFADRWFEDRVPVRLHRTHNIHFRPVAAERFLSCSYESWRNFSPCERQLFFTALTIHVRNPIYEWDWERFSSEYTVLDTLWNAIAPRLGLSKKQQHKLSHECRLHVACEAFGIVRPADHVACLIGLRHRLIHEGLWDGAPVGTGNTGRAWHKTECLRRINQRLIAAALGYKSETYVTSEWIKPNGDLPLGAYDFDPLL